MTANAIVSPAGAPAIIDWAGAGVAPRLWTLAFLLWSAGLSGPRCVEAAVEGYRRHVELGPAELDRLESALAARPLIFDTWAYATGRRPLTDGIANRAWIKAEAGSIAGRVRAAHGGPLP